MSSIPRTASTRRWTWPFRRQDRTRGGRTFPRRRRARRWMSPACTSTPGLIDIHVHVYPATGQQSSLRGDSSVQTDASRFARRHHGGGCRHFRLAQFPGVQDARDRPVAHARAGAAEHRRRRAWADRRGRAGRRRHGCRRPRPRLRWDNRDMVVGFKSAHYRGAGLDSGGARGEGRQDRRICP